MMDMAEHHPVLLEFFEKADEVLDLTDEQKKRLGELQQLFTLGNLTEEQTKELERDFFEPYNIKKIQQEKTKQ